jgi:phosphoribosyl 1,2-cyclic phosphate phosphodiesterase
MKFIILGCGSSMGVPRPDGYFGNCDPKNKKNYRTRCSALIKSKAENILIDTSPDLRQQLLRHNIKKIDKVFYSHMHADQTHGINDLRSFYINSRKQINVFADYATSKYLKNSFSYCFKSYSKEYPATLKLNKINNKMYIDDKNKKISIKPISVDHGKVKSNCFIIDKN